MLLYIILAFVAIVLFVVLGVESHRVLLDDDGGGTKNGRSVLKRR